MLTQTIFVSRVCLFQVHVPALTCDPVMQRRARQKLLECTDLGRTEKEFVLNWNSAVHADPILSDAYTAQACSHFAKEHAEVSTTLQPQLTTLMR